MIAGHVDEDDVGVTGAAVVAVTGSVVEKLVEPVKHKVNKKSFFLLSGPAAVALRHMIAKIARTLILKSQG